VPNVLFVYLIWITFYLPPRVSSCLFYVRSNLNFILRYKYKCIFVYLIQITFYLPPHDVSFCLFYVRSNLNCFYFTLQV
jgi:hypothetical protein